MSLSFYPFHDLSEALQRHLLQGMIVAFGKPWANPVTLRRRFLRPSCRVGLFRHEGVLKGACFLWREPDLYYLDKFYVFAPYQHQRLGIPFVTLLIASYSPLLWRTDAILASRFYGKHPAVRTLGTHGTYVYQCTDGHIALPTLPHESLLALLPMETAFCPT